MSRRRGNGQGPRPQSAGEYEGRSRAAWNHTERLNEYSSRTVTSSQQGSPHSHGQAATHRQFNTNLHGRHGNPHHGHHIGGLGHGYGPGLPPISKNLPTDCGPRARENRLGLHRLDRGFVAGCRPPPQAYDAGQSCFQRTGARRHGRLTSFEKLGFGQDPDRNECVDRDEHLQSHHPLLHRHSPLGAPRRLGSGPEHFERAVWDSSCSRFYNNNEGVRNLHLQQDLSPRGNPCDGVRGRGNRNFNRPPNQRARGDSCCSTCTTSEHTNQHLRGDNYCGTDTPSGYPSERQRGDNSCGTDTPSGYPSQRQRGDNRCGTDTPSGYPNQLRRGDNYCGSDTPSGALYSPTDPSCAWPPTAAYSPSRGWSPPSGPCSPSGPFVSPAPYSRTCPDYSPE